MAIESYNPSVFIQRIESVGVDATKQIVVNTTQNLQVAQSINILDIDYLIVKIDADTKTVTLDKDRNANINLQTTPTIEVRQNVADDLSLQDVVVPISDTERKQKLIELQAQLYQRELNKAQEIIGTDYYGMRLALESETRSFLATFNDDHTPILKVVAGADSEAVEVVATRFKKKLVKFEMAKQILQTQFINLSIKVKQAQGQKELDSISFT